MKKTLTLLLIAIATLSLSALAKDTDAGKVKLAQKPPMGWNSFDGFGCAIYEELALREAEAFVKDYAPHGYEYFVIDNGWFSSPETVTKDGLLLPISQHAHPDDVTIDEYGIPKPSKKFFPNGFKPLTDMLHPKGLKLGLHLMRGIPRLAVQRNTPIKGTPYRAKDIHRTEQDCSWCQYMHGIDMTKPGAQEYLNTVVAEFAAWGVDFIKIDDAVEYPAEIIGYAKAIKNSGRPMLLSVSAGNKVNQKYIPAYKRANMVRITHDIWDTQESIESSFKTWRIWSGLEEPGFWPDLDMLPYGELCILKRDYNREAAAKKNISTRGLRFGGGYHHQCLFTKPQQETFMTQRAMSASPLMMGGSLATMDEFSYRMLTNKHMLECNQNGVSGRLMSETDGIEVWMTPRKNTDQAGWQRYDDATAGWIGVFNRIDEKKSATLSKFPKEIGIPGNDYNFYDIWRDKAFSLKKSKNELTLDIEPNGVAFLRFEKSKN